MTFNEYINNPQGKANAVISHREMYRNLYTEKLNNIMVRENGKVDYSLYETSKYYICHMKVPSEVIADFYYDVVIQFTKTKFPTTLSDLEVKFYSNDPSFVFTFAHAFIKNKMFINALEDKMSKKAVKDKAVERNPKDQIGYVKSLYFAYILMGQKGLFNPVKYKAEQKTFSERILKSNIMHADEKIELRQSAQAESKKTNKKEKSVVADTRRARSNIVNPNSSDTTPISSGIKRTGFVKTTAKSGNVKKSNNIRKTKRI